MKENQSTDQKALLVYDKNSGSVRAVHRYSGKDYEMVNPTKENEKKFINFSDKNIMNAFIKN